MSIFYITNHNADVYIKDGHFICEADNLKKSLPIEMLEGVLLFSNTNLGSRTIKELLTRKIPVTFLSSHGKYYGKLESSSGINIERQRKQFRLGDDKEFCCRLAKKIILAKSNNQIIIAKRYNRIRKHSAVDENLVKMQINRRKIESANSIEEINGYEGIIARYYFDSLSKLCRDEYKFNGRSRMPPKDPFNSVISLGYTILLNEIYVAIQAKGLNPYAGFMHKDKQGHIALASDLIEEWRAVIIDSLAMNMLNSYEIKPTDFEKNLEGGVIIGKDALKKIILKLEEKLKTETSYLDYIDGTVSFRRAIMAQAGSLAKAIENNDVDLYRPIYLR